MPELEISNNVFTLLFSSLLALLIYGCVRRICFSAEFRAEKICEQSRFDAEAVKAATRNCELRLETARVKLSREKLRALAENPLLKLKEQDLATSP
ncbi:MAG TPA: hypothetical protein PKA76_19540 [Pirellulaceae bacterium]|nr:hypothetical protein [Pirellulaceae bacterium]